MIPFSVVENLHIAPVGLNKLLMESVILSATGQLRTGIPGCSADYLDQLFNLSETFLSDQDAENPLPECRVLLRG